MGGRTVILERNGRTYCCVDCGTLLISEQAILTGKAFGRGLCTICALLAKPLEKKES